MKKIMRFAFPYMRKSIKGLLWYGFLCMILSVMTMYLPYYSGSFIDLLIDSARKSFILRYIAVLFSIGISLLLLSFLRSYVAVKLTTGIGFDINLDLITKLQRAQISETSKYNTTYLNQRVYQDTNYIAQFIVSSIQMIILNILSIMVAVLYTLNLNPQYIWLYAAVIAAYCGIYILGREKLYNTSMQFKEAQSKYFTKLFEQMENIPFLVRNGINDTFSKKLDSEYRCFFQSLMKSQKVNYAYSGVDGLLSQTINIMIYMLAGFAIIDGMISIGQFTVLLAYSSMIIGAVRFFFSFGQSVQECKASCSRLSDFLAMKEAPNGKERLTKVDTVELADISFSYDGRKEVVSSLNCAFEKGNIYIVTGDNGSGKSTLVDILCGLYSEEQQGKVNINGLDISQIDMIDLRREHIGISEQEPFLFSDSVAFNIDINGKQYDEIVYADLVERLGLDGFIESLPHGIHTNIKESTYNVSGGEKQKISLLRALLKNPDLIILDEPTSALSFEAGEALGKYLREIKKDKIIIVVSHDHRFISICEAKHHISL